MPDHPLIKPITHLRRGLALGVLSLASLVADARQPLPNIVFILADDLGYGDLGCYNQDSRIPTPNIDRLAAEGMRFTDAHAAGPLCHPSRYGLMTGRYPFRTDVSRWPTQPLIEPGQMTLASMLAAQGYETHMVGKWHLGFMEKGYDDILAGGPVDHGFSGFYGMRASTDIPPYFWIRQNRAVQVPNRAITENHSPGWARNQGAFWREGKIAPDMDLAAVLPELTREACKIILAKRDADAPSSGKPLFLYLAYTAPHTPWLPSAEFVGKSAVGMYGDFMMMLDHQVGAVIKSLDDAGLDKDTMVVFTSDNGPLWNPADVERFGHDSAGGLRGMKGDAWEGGHRMPFIVRWPGRVEQASTTGQTICFTDFLATCADICKVDLPADAAPDSFSFLPVLEGRQPANEPIRGPIVMQAGSTRAMMIRSGDWKLIDRPGSGGFSKSPAPEPNDPPGQLYHLRDDPGERTNLYQKHPERVAELTREMERIILSKQTRAD